VDTTFILHHFMQPQVNMEYYVEFEVTSILRTFWNKKN